MTFTPISFTPVNEWVDYTDPTNVPPTVRVISASDLLRYENGINAVVQRSNEHSTTLDSMASSITSLQSALSSLQSTVTTQATTITSQGTTIANQTTEINNLKRPIMIRSTTTAYTMVVANRIHVHTGGAATYTLPTAVGNSGIDFIIHNRGTGTLTVNSASGTTQFWANGGAFATKPVLTNETIHIVSDNANWVVLVTDSNATT
jgi:hypothetical protein